MNLIDLNARFIKLQITAPMEHWPNGRPDHIYVDNLNESDGVEFLCPLCFKNNNGEVGTHSLICYWKGKVPDWIEPGPGRWNPQGTGLKDITFVSPGSTSVAVLSGCMAHFHVTDGKIVT